MSEKPKDDEPKRHNRAVAVSEALGGVLDAALKKRGFATRDLLVHWAAMAPKPYDRLAAPQELKWPRGAGHEGATLYLRCLEGHGLALSHEAPRIAAAVNRYFGYFLVREVKLSAEPLVRAMPTAPPTGPANSPKVAGMVATVADEPLRDALQMLGNRVAGGHRSQSKVTKT